MPHFFFWKAQIFFKKDLTNPQEYSIIILYTKQTTTKFHTKDELAKIKRGQNCFTCRSRCTDTGCHNCRKPQCPVKCPKPSKMPHSDRRSFLSESSFFGDPPPVAYGKAYALPMGTLPIACTVSEHTIKKINIFKGLLFS